MTQEEMKALANEYSSDGVQYMLTLFGLYKELRECGLLHVDAIYIAALQLAKDGR